MPMAAAVRRDRSGGLGLRRQLRDPEAVAHGHWLLVAARAAGTATARAGTLGGSGGRIVFGHGGDFLERREGGRGETTGGLKAKQSSAAVSRNDDGRRAKVRCE